MWASIYTASRDTRYNFNLVFEGSEDLLNWNRTCVPKTLHTNEPIVMIFYVEKSRRQPHSTEYLLLCKMKLAINK